MKAKITGPKATLVPQIKIITEEAFNDSNRELNEDCPGNYQTIDEYINMIIEELPNPSRIDFYPNGGKYLAAIHYSF
jgi:hypothetical protein